MNVWPRAASSKRSGRNRPTRERVRLPLPPPPSVLTPASRIETATPTPRYDYERNESERMKGREGLRECVSVKEKER